MSDAPERITLRVDPLGRLDWPSHGNLDDAEVRYIRADLVPSPAAIRAEALEEAAKVADRWQRHFADAEASAEAEGNTLRSALAGSTAGAAHGIADEIRALIGGADR